MGKATGRISTWDMSSKEARERQVKHDFEYAKTERAEQTEKMIELNNYYNNITLSKEQVDALADKYGLKYSPPGIPYSFIHVESQIENVIPQFQFKGRDDDLDSARAKIREQVAEFIMYNNKVSDINLDNERTLNEIGNAFWKVAFDGSITGPGFVGDIVIGNPDPANIFPMPGAYDVDDCEYIIYAYRLHRRKARRTFGEIIDEIYNDNDHATTEIYDNIKRSIDDDSLQVAEYWYRDDDGDIACSIQVNNVEVKHIPKYWVKTRLSGNKMYPIIKYCKIPVRKSFWDKGEIETIKDLVDAGNREFFTALMNDMFCANDIVIREKTAMENDPVNMPGAQWIVKDNRASGVRRLGGVSENSNLLNMIKFIEEKIQDTTGNYAAKGTEPTKVTTASGFAQLREDREARAMPKKAGRLEGFQKLAELIDWTALEFYNTDRIILIRGKKEGEPDTMTTYNSDNMRMESGKYDKDGNPVFYYPKVDIEITAGDGISKSKAFTLRATQELAKMPINPQNMGIVLSIVDLLDLPNKDEVKASIQQGLGVPLPGQEQQPGGGGMSQLVQSLPQEVADFMAQNMSDEEKLNALREMLQISPEQLPQYWAQMMGDNPMGQA